MNNTVTQLKSLVLERADPGTDMGESELLRIIDETVCEYAHANYTPVSMRQKLRKNIYNSIRKLDILEDLLEDDTVTEIMINGYDRIFVERKGCLEKCEKSFESRERLEDIIQQIASKANRRINESSPILDTRLESGARVNIVLSPISLDGSVVTIRKFYRTPLTMSRLIETGSISQEMADFLKTAVENKCNIFISGGTGAGKTTFLNILSEYIPGDERVITIEDSAELQIKHISNLVRLETRCKNIEGKNEIKIRDLIKTSLRMRPDRIIIGEVRGEETIDLLQGLNTGHNGSLSTGHSNSASDMISRLETMFLMGMDMSLSAVRMQIASAIDIVVHLKRYREGTRRVEEISEVAGYSQGEVIMNTLFCYDSSSDTYVSCGQIKSKKLKEVYEKAVYINEADT